MSRQSIEASMHLPVHLKAARLEGMGLAKVGHPLREEPLQTSKALCRFRDEEAELLTRCFLRPFRALEPHRFFHSNDLAWNTVYSHARAVFRDKETLLERSARIAEHLYAESRHPNIKSGDLCVALLEGVSVGDELTRGLCLIKSESKVPFLQIAVRDGDLQLVTQQGIYPDKVDKGCLILDCQEEGGYVTCVFDKGGATAHFWMRDFLGVRPWDEGAYHTRRYSEMCVAFAEKGLPEEICGEERVKIANRAFDYLDEHDEFDLQDFKEVALAEPELIEQFADFKSRFEDERGEALKESFSVAKGAAEKGRKKLKARLKLDTGAEIRFSSGFIKESDRLLERGFDEDKHMKFVKIYFHEES